MKSMKRSTGGSIQSPARLTSIAGSRRDPQEEHDRNYVPPIPKCPTRAQMIAFSEEPIMYERLSAHVLGSVAAAVWMGNANLYRSSMFVTPDGWYERSAAQIQIDTGLNRFEEASARRCLRELGVLVERKASLPARTQFRINDDRVHELIRQAIEGGWVIM